MALLQTVREFFTTQANKHRVWTKRFGFGDGTVAYVERHRNENSVFVKLRTVNEEGKLFSVKLNSSEAFDLAQCILLAATGGEPHASNSNEVTQQ